MAANIVYITAGLPVAKNAGQAPASLHNTAYITAGLPPVVLTAGGANIPAIMHHYRQMRRAC